MRVLYLVPYAPSLIRVRSYQLIRALAWLGHDVTVATLWSSSEELEGLRQLETEKIEVLVHRLPMWRPAWNCLRTLPTRMPLQAAFSWEPGLLRLVKSAIRERPFDIVHIEHLRGSLFGLNIARWLGRNGDSVAEGNGSTPVIWDSVDCISHLFQQAGRCSRSYKGKWMARLELPRTRRFEGWLVSQFDKVLATSAVDRNALLKLGEEASPGLRSANLNVHVVPNGVDLEYFRANLGPREEATIVFSGKMSYHANVTAVRSLVHEIMPRIWKRRPNVKLVLVGKDPPRSVLSQATSGATGSQSTADRTVIVTGTVPDIRPYLQKATLAVLPLVYGAGTQLKILEAMASATPVITSARALVSLSVQDGRDLLAAESVDDFARKVLDVLSNTPLREALGLAGRAYVEKHHDWRRIGVGLEGIYQEVASLSQRKASKPLCPADMGESEGA